MNFYPGMNSFLVKCAQVGIRQNNSATNIVYLCDGQVSGAIQFLYLGCHFFFIMVDYNSFYKLKLLPTIVTKMLFIHGKSCTSKNWSYLTTNIKQFVIVCQRVRRFPLSIVHALYFFRS